MYCITDFLFYLYMCMCALIAKLCLTLCDIMDYSQTMGLSRQELGCNFLLPGTFPTQGIKPVSPALLGRFFIH